MNVKHRFLKRFAALAAVLVLLVQAFPQPAAAKSDPGIGSDLKEVWVTHEGERYDLLSEVMNIPGGFLAELPFELSVNEDSVGDVEIVDVGGDDFKLLYRGKKRSFSLSTLDFNEKTILKARVYDKGGTRIWEYVLGLRVLKGRAQDFEKPIEVGLEAGSGVVVSMDKFCPGMALKMLPFVIPVTAKVTADGRTIIGFGANSGDVNFWKEALTTNKIAENISKAKMYKQFCEEHDTKWMGGGKPVAAWSVSGSAISYEKNPQKVTGTINVFYGIAYGGAWQYEMIVIDVGITGGLNGTWTWTFDPEKNPDSSVKIELEGRFRIDVGAGLGVANVFSAGVYGAGGITVGGQIIPDLKFTKVILSGEFGIRAKLFGRTLFQWTIISGSHDLLKGDTNEAGTEELLQQKLDAILAADYASTYAVARNEINEEPVWYGTEVSRPSERTGEANSEKNGINQHYAHRLASNIFPESEIQCCEIPGHSGEYLITFIGNDVSRAPGNRETLMYAVYSEATDSVTEPKPVWTSENYAGMPDYRPNLYAGRSDKEIYLAWEKAVSPIGAEDSFSDIAAKCGIATAHYNAASGSFTDQYLVSQDSACRQAEPKAFMVSHLGRLVPAIAYYTQPLDDPAGISAEAEHELRVVSYNRVNEEWDSERLLTTVRGRVLSFDAAVDSKYEPYLAYTVKTPDGKLTSGSTASEALPEGATNVRFAKYQGNTVLTYRKDDRIYALPKSGETAITPEDTLPPEEYNIFGDLGKNCMIVGTSSGQYSQDAVALLHSENDGWYNTQLTEVDAFSNVNYFTAAYGNSRPVILYSVQRYAMTKEPVTYANEAGSNAAFMDPLPYEETTGDLYIQAGDANRHATIVSAYTENEVTEDGVVVYANATVKNTGLEAIDRLYCYSRDGYDRWWEMMLESTDRIGAGQTVDFRFPVNLPYDADGYPYPFDTRVGIRLEDSPVGDVMSEYPVTIEAEDYHVLVKHKYRNSYESLMAVAGFDGPGVRSGKLVFYDPDKGTVYAEQPFSKLKAPKTVSATLDAPDHMFVKGGISKIAVRIVDENETAEEAKAAEPDYVVNVLDAGFEVQERELTPSTIVPETETEESTSPAEPGTGRKFPLWIPIGGVAVVIVTLLLLVLFRRKKNKQENE